MILALCMLMQEQVEAQELGERNVEKLIKDLQNGKLSEIDQLAQQHIAHVSSVGVSGGSHIAINGKLHALEASAMVWL